MQNLKIHSKPIISENAFLNDLQVLCTHIWKTLIYITTVLQRQLLIVENWSWCLKVNRLEKVFISKGEMMD